MKDYLETDANLSELPVDQYDNFVFDIDPLEEQYHHQWLSNFPPDRILPLVVLSITTVQLISSVFMAISGYFIYRLILKQFRLESGFDFLDFSCHFPLRHTILIDRNMLIQ